MTSEIFVTGSSVPGRLFLDVAKIISYKKLNMPSEHYLLTLNQFEDEIHSLVLNVY